MVTTDKLFLSKNCCFNYLCLSRLSVAFLPGFLKWTQDGSVKQPVSFQSCAATLAAGSLSPAASCPLPQVSYSHLFNKKHRELRIILLALLNALPVYSMFFEENNALRSLYSFKLNALCASLYTNYEIKSWNKRLYAQHSHCSVRLPLVLLPGACADSR